MGPQTSTLNTQTDSGVGGAGWVPLNLKPQTLHPKPGRDPNLDYLSLCIYSNIYIHIYICVYMNTYIYLYTILYI